MTDKETPGRADERHPQSSAYQTDVAGEVRREANALHPPAQLNADLPSAIDPRGMLTFGVAGLGLWVIAWLILRGSQFARGLGYLGYLTAALLIVVYLARLIVLDATSLLVVGPALLLGFVASPVWYVWLGVSLWRGARA